MVDSSDSGTPSPFGVTRPESTSMLMPFPDKEFDQGSVVNESRASVDPRKEKRETFEVETKFG